ncbi:MAG: FAD-dependent oxidoreductase [Gammaproteobacteria bacterium]
MKIVVAGGGYAGLSCLMEIADRLPDAERVLVDPSRWHLRQTRLQEALRRSLDGLRTPFSELGDQYGFRHVRASPSLSRKALARASAAGRLAGEGIDEDFDALVVAVGLRPRPRPRQARWVGLADLKGTDGRRLVRRIIEEAGGASDRVTIVGGGATGLQYLFELRDALRREGAKTRLALVDPGRRLLPGQPDEFHAYVAERMEQSGITYLGGYGLASAGDGELELKGRQGGVRRLRSAFSFSFTGMKGNPSVLETAPTGQVLLAGGPSERIFAAGDCSSYRGGGFDSPSAQAAVRKGRLVAANLERFARGGRLKSYDSPELGFFLSMGVLDGIGWVGDRRVIVTGSPAFAVREAIEARYELLLRGIDTFGLL